ncbi:MAG: Autotransporter adhesin [Myxococcales bacterium]|nr:Autotransporter adhesin [Myxococcales bacterium]
MFDFPPVSSPDAATGYVATVLADRPLGYFRLGESSGVTAADQIENGPPGLVVGNVRYGQIGALATDPDTAVGIDGVNGAVEAGSSFDFSANAPFSLECWVKPAAFDAGFHTLVSRWLAPPNNVGYNLYYQAEVVRFAREDASIGAYDATMYTGLVAEVYSHVVATYDGQTIALYINGRQYSQAASLTALRDLPLTFMIGASNNDPATAPLNGLIDEVAIYGTALAPTQVAAHYAAGIMPPTGS